MDFSTVTEFEQALADYFGAPVAVATDCCTHALELCLRYQEIKQAECPTHTYISVPFTLMKLGLDWQWWDQPWSGWYALGKTNILDAAALFERDSYVPGKWMCVSFQANKALSLGRGAMILLDDHQAAWDLRAMAYDGRQRGIPWAQQSITTMGYHYYMTPETAAAGLEKLDSVAAKTHKIWNWRDYPYLPDLPVFSNSPVDKH
jgi:dTDP-4-amino-4,6-dideoxygalactose transaminase